MQEFVRGALARHRATGENYLVALGSLIRRNNRRYGGYIVHLAILLIGAGAVGSQIYQQQTQATLAPGESVTLAGYTVTAHGIETNPLPGVKVTEGVLSVNGSDEIRPAKQFFDNFPQQPSTRVGLRSTPFEDLYIVLGGWEGDGPTARVSVAVFVNPLVSWIWTGGVLLLLGTVVTLWPAPVVSRRRVTAPISRVEPWARRRDAARCRRTWLDRADAVVALRWRGPNRSTIASAGLPCSCSVRCARARPSLTRRRAWPGTCAPLSGPN